MSLIKRYDRSHVCYMKPLDSFKNWNDQIFWVDDFACPARFSWHIAKNVTRDPAPVAANFHVQYYATLVAQPPMVRKFPEEFLCLVGLSRHYTLDEETYPLFLDKDGEDIDIFAFIHTSDPTKVKVDEGERKEDEPRLLETTVGRTVPLLRVAPDCGESELDASVDKLFDEGGSGSQTEQGDFPGGRGEQGMNIQPVTKTTDVVAKDVIPLEDHGTPSGASVDGKSRSAVQRLFARAVQNAKVRGKPIPTMPFVTSSVYATSEREGEDSSHHSGANIAEAEVDSFARPSVPVITAATTITSTADFVVVVKEKIVEPSLFVAESTSTGRTDPNMAGLTDLTGSDFLIGGEMKYVVEEKNQLLKAIDKEIKNLKAQLLLKEAEAAEAIHLRTKASKLETAKKSLEDEVTALNERNTILKKERNALDMNVTDLEAVVV
nr:hypothetical protein [Tanacetum cinerariifolium]